MNCTWCDVLDPVFVGSELLHFASIHQIGWFLFSVSVVNTSLHLVLNFLHFVFKSLYVSKSALSTRRQNKIWINFHKSISQECCFLLCIFCFFFCFTSHQSPWFRSVKFFVFFPRFSRSFAHFNTDTHIKSFDFSLHWTSVRVRIKVLAGVTVL